APKWLGTMMKYFDGSSARSGPVIHCAVSDGVAVNHVGHTTALSLAALSSPSVRYPSLASGSTTPFWSAKSPSEKILWSTVLLPVRSRRARLYRPGEEESPASSPVGRRGGAWSQSSG